MDRLVLASNFLFRLEVSSSTKKKLLGERSDPLLGGLIDSLIDIPNRSPRGECNTLDTHFTVSFASVGLCTASKNKPVHCQTIVNSCPAQLVGSLKRTHTLCLPWSSFLSQARAISGLVLVLCCPLGVFVVADRSYHVMTQCPASSQFDEVCIPSSCSHHN